MGAINGLLDSVDLTPEEAVTAEKLLRDTLAVAR
jgi:hypothetical protein